MYFKSKRRNPQNQGAFYLFLSLSPFKIASRTLARSLVLMDCAFYAWLHLKCGVSLEFAGRALKMNLGTMWSVYIYTAVKMKQSPYMNTFLLYKGSIHLTLNIHIQARVISREGDVTMVFYMPKASCNSTA